MPVFDLADAEAFLEQLRQLCSEKAAQYEKRVALRVNEETAVAKAIAILNSDMAFESFGKVAATSTGSTGMLQTSTGRKGGAPSFLQRGRCSARVSRVQRTIGCVRM